MSFLAYDCHIHPGIRRQIAASGQIPRQLIVHWHEFNTQGTATYRLMSAEQVKTDSSALPANARPAQHPGDPFYRVLFLVGDEGHSTHRITREDAVDFANRAVGTKHYLDALLALIEYGLQSGEQPAAELGKHMAEFRSDAQCRLYLTAVHQPIPSKEGARKCLASCESIDRGSLQKGYMIDLQRADLLAQLSRGGVKTDAQIKEFKTAEQLFIKVLGANPFLAGAYHDLGQLYFDGFAHEKAWMCFDTARRLYPDHPLMKDITALERRYERDFPDLF